MTLGRFYGIGVGPGDPGLLTIRGAELIASVDVIFEAIGKNSKGSIAGSVVDSVSGCKADRTKLFFSMSLDNIEREEAYKENAIKVVADLKRGLNCAFVTIGDPLTYSTYIYLLREIQKTLPSLCVETVPGITSYQTAASKMNFPLIEDTEKLIVVPAFSEDMIEDFPLDDADTIVFLKIYHNRSKLLAFLKKKGLHKSLLYAARLGLEGELVTDDFSVLEALPDEYLSLLIVKK